METRSLIITGMHRSGTSLAAQIFYRAGLFMGDNLMEPSPNNPDGYFEDRDIIAFHNEIFRFNGIDRWESPSTLSARIEMPEGSPAKATALIESKFDARSIWGWKDPRTSWFLPFWKNIIPEAYFIFTYRKPEEVVWSLMRRGDYKQYSSSRIQQILLAVKHWVKTYQEILDFLKDNEDSSLLFFIPDDVHNKEMRSTIVHVVCDLWGLSLSDLDNQIAQTFKPRLLKNKVPSTIKLITNLYLPARRTNNQIINVHRKMLSKYSKSGGYIHQAALDRNSAGSNAVVSVVSPEQDLYSETFIQAHIDRLPTCVKPLYGYPLPNYSDEGEVLYSSSNLGNRILRVAGRKIQKLSNKSLHEMAIKKFLKKNNVELVLAEYGYTGVAMLEICREVKIPLVVHFHGHDAYQKKILNVEGQSYTELFKFAAALIVVSKDMCHQLISLGAQREKIIINPCGVDIHQFKGGDPSKAPQTFVAVGRFVDKKAPHLTLLAFSEVLVSYPEARLIMLGDGPLLEACIQLAQALCISSAVDFRGPRSHAEVAEIMRQSRAFVQHSVHTSYGDSEGTPVAVIEACATGLPVVATRHAGIQDVIIEGESGFLVPEGDVGAMARSMKLLAQDPVLAARFGRKGRERVKQEYSMDDSIDRLWKVIERAIGMDMKISPNN